MEGGIMRVGNSSGPDCKDVEHVSIVSVPLLGSCFPWLIPIFLDYSSAIPFPWYGTIPCRVPDEVFYVCSAIILGNCSWLPSINLCPWPLFWTTDVNFHLLLDINIVHVKYNKKSKNNLKTICSFCILYFINNHDFIIYICFAKGKYCIRFFFSLSVTLDIQSVIFLKYMLYLTPYFNTHLVLTIIIFV